MPRAVDLQGQSLKLSTKATVFKRVSLLIGRARPPWPPLDTGPVDAAAESVNCSLFLKNLEKHFCDVTCKTTASNTFKIYRNIYRKNLTAIIYRLPISLLEMEINRLSVSPRAFLKLSIIVIALIQKGVSCPSLNTIPLIQCLK